LAGGRKRFFFEKKKQKTFIPGRSGSVRESPLVFWFSIFKKAVLSSP
jgi:hypothetical protein